MKQENEKRRPYGVFIINEYIRDGEPRTQWLRIGAAFKNRDDSFNLILRALPLPDPKTGVARLHMRLPLPKPETQDDDDSFYLEIDPLMGAPLEKL